MRNALLLSLFVLASLAAACESPGSGPDGPCACVVPNGDVLLACGTQSCIDGDGWVCTQGVISAAPSACEPPPDCKPICNDAVCGTDGCGGSCGTCPAGKVCGGGFCVTEGGPCVPTCNSAVCGPDGCGGECGTCAAGSSCAGGTCKSDVTCKPICNDAVCGPDGCGGVCGTCDADKVCTAAGFCQPKSDTCEPQCGGAECGPDGCGGVCGTCGAAEKCDAGQCVDDPTVCTPGCGGKVCGPDGCGGVCGTCGAAEKCDAGQCVDDPPICTPACGGKVCGPDGCGGQCGSCKAGELCAAGKCEPEDVGCPAGLFECDGKCVDYLSDPLHCGSCAGKCPTQQGALAICIQAECYLSCEDQKDTPANVKFSSDINNCGECGKVCPSMPGGKAQCSGGKCQDPCDVVGLDACGGKCVSLYSDENNCGKCGEVCAPDAECKSGSCYCGSWEKHCSGQCVDDDDVDHCEACDTPCPEVEHGTRDCWSNQCEFSCDQNYTDCGGSDACIGAGGAPCESDADCCGEEGYVCYLGQCTGYPKCNSPQDCPDPPNYECAFDVCLRKCNKSSQCADDSGLYGSCYVSYYSSAHGFWVGTDACYLSCSSSEPCPYEGMSCATTNWSGSNGRMCVWN